jgi:hypothetical protein
MKSMLCVILVFWRQVLEEDLLTEEDVAWLPAEKAKPRPPSYNPATANPEHLLSY